MNHGGMRSGSMDKVPSITELFFYVRKLSERSEIGGGLYASRNLLVPNFNPIFHFEYEFTNRIVMTLDLPKRGHHSPTTKCERMFFIAKTEFVETRYNIRNPFPGTTHIALRKVDMLMSLAAERELHDWLWISAEGGFTFNIQYFLAESGDRIRDSVVDMKAGPTIFTRINLFIVPPTRFFD